MNVRIQPVTREAKSRTDQVTELVQAMSTVQEVRSARIVKVQLRSKMRAEIKGNAGVHTDQRGAERRWCTKARNGISGVQAQRGSGSGRDRRSPWRADYSRCGYRRRGFCWYEAWSGIQCLAGRSGILRDGLYRNNQKKKSYFQSVSYQINLTKVRVRKINAPRCNACVLPIR
jgi:hypothetical protein